MRGSYEYILCAVSLFLGFLLLFLWIGSKNIIGRIMKNTLEQMDDSARRRLLEERKKLLEGTSDNSIWYRLEKLLFYSGLKWKFPFLTVELFLALNVCLFAFAGFGGFLAYGIWGVCAAGVAVFMLEAGLIQAGRMSNNRIVNGNLAKFLDFLGNYSVTSGEITAIFEQISHYLDEPLSHVLEECCHEAAFTGDTNMALLYMREKVEHPQFKALVNNIEINMRYCADYNLLVQSSRRSLRDYMKSAGERMAMLRESALNMGLLLVMSFLSLFIVDRLIESSIWDILFFTLPGRISLGITVLIIVLFVGKVLENAK